MASDTLTISSAIGANGTNALVKSGAGSVTLSGANTFSGGVFLNGKYSNDNGGGNLEVSADANLGAPTGGITFNGGTLSLVNPYLTLSAAPVMVNAAGGSIGGYYWNGGITTITIASNISGTGPLNVNLGYGLQQRHDFHRQQRRTFRRDNQRRWRDARVPRRQLHRHRTGDL